MAERTPVQAVERRQWWPFFLVDEEMPAGRDTPDAWLCRLHDGAHAYGTDDWGVPALAEGEVVTFSVCDTIGTTRMTLVGGKPHWQPAIPAEVDHLWDGEDIIARSADEFVDQLGGYVEDGEPILVHLSRWPGSTLYFKFTALDGPPRFLPLDPIPEPPAARVSPPADPQTDLFRPVSVPPSGGKA